MVINCLKRIWHFWHAVVLGFINDGCLSRAAALAYTAILSIVPLMTLSFTLLKAFPVFKGINEKIQAFVFSNFVASSASVVQAHLQSFTERVSNLSAPGLLFLFVTAVLMIFNMEAAFNVIWKVKEKRHGVQAFLMYWAVLTLLPILIGVGFAMSSYFTTLKIFADATASFGLEPLIFKVAPYFLTFLAFSLIYTTVPNCKVKFRHAVVGGIVATALFEFAKWGFALYITTFPTYELLYGALAAIPIFLVWVYMSWLVILFGAQVSRQMGVVRKTMINGEKT